MSNVNFVSDTLYGILHNSREKEVLKLDGKKYDNGDTIVQFFPFYTIDTYKGYKVKKGFLILDSEKDKERIEFLRKYPDFGHGYKETTQVPRETFDNGSVITGVTTTPQSQTINPIDLQKAAVTKAIRWTELKQRNYKTDGSLRADSKEAEVNEFKDLSKELNLQ